jgi:hypothetical protein
MSGECNICGEMGCVEANHAFSPDYGCKLCDEHIREHLETAKMLAKAQAEIDRLRAEIDRITTGVRCFAYDHEADPVDCLTSIKRFLSLPNAQDLGRA